MSLPSEYRTVGTKTETYAWSGDGVRLSATSGNGPSGTARFLVDRAFDLPTVALERDGNGKLVRRYSYGLDLLAQTTPTKGPYWYHHDGLGSVTDVTSPTGTSLWWMEYTPFGAPRASASTSQSPTNLFRFTGAYFDTVTALYHLRARQYDPTTGRFLSTDPVAAPVADPYVASYVYAGNNPVLYDDPSGRCLLVCAVVGGIVGGIAGAGGYVISSVLSGQQFEASQLAVAVATSAGAGAVCGATALVGCVLAGSAASVTQYHLSPGDKDIVGYAAAGTVGAVITGMFHTRTPPVGIPLAPGASAALRPTVTQQINHAVYHGLVNFPRSISSNNVANWSSSFLNPPPVNAGAVGSSIK